jgi:hypothetical protein
MTHTETSRRPRLHALAGGLLALMLAGGAFAATHKAATPKPPAQETFATPEQAADALAAAWRTNSKPDLTKIFGPAGAKLVSSGDPVADRNVKARLAAAYDTQHRIVSLGSARALLVIGKNGFSFPIPLARESGKKGDAWYFDTQAGAEEILDRRIGRNELDAIGVCRAYVEAQRDYATRSEPPGTYAMKIASSPGKHDGLYWPAAAGEPPSPFGPLIAAASDQGYRTGAKDTLLAPYHGYRYKILTAQGPNAPGRARSYIVDGRMTGGYALVAWPAEYGNSGVMTFIVNQNGIVFEKNLGKETAQLARKMTTFNPDSSWHVAVTPER